MSNFIKQTDADLKKNTMLIKKQCISKIQKKTAV